LCNIPYPRPYRRPFNYPENKKYFDLDAHIWVFKANIKANNEIVNEEIMNLFNFTLKDNASNLCNNYMQDHPNCKFIELNKISIDDTK